MQTAESAVILSTSQVCCPILHDISYIYCIIIITIDFSLLEISLLCVVRPECHYAPVKKETKQATPTKLLLTKN
ncbi:hypothetical protein SAMN05428949_5441 [Chitinophaga sp. YR627]|nr:hypothetical protein SAMN05428949_5441 [Chitinophaga sp. YR627]